MKQLNSPTVQLGNKAYFSSDVLEVKTVKVIKKNYLRMPDKNE